MGEQQQGPGRQGVWREVLAELLRDLRPLAAPALVLLITLFAVMAGVSLPASLSGLRGAGPYFLLGLAVALAIWFNRGRPFIAAATLLGAYAAYSLALELRGPAGAAPVFLAVALLVPFNLLLTVLLAEHSFFHRQNLRWLAIAVVEVALVTWIASAAQDGSQAWLQYWLWRSPPTPVAARALFVAAFTVALMRAWPKPPATAPLPLDLAMVGTLTAFFFACEWASSPGGFNAFIAAAGVLLLVAMLQEFYRLAFRDELTALPGRRAFEERLRGLAGKDKYTLAVVDVDHFKRFNDEHGHDIGDQVLKLVAARLAEASGGGTAYRYGGEEFVMLYPDQVLAQAEPALERVRQSVQDYRMAVRAPDRPRGKLQGAVLRRDQAPGKTLAVTVSMGLAERNAQLDTPARVLKAADEALYRAKEAGRNRLSR